MQLTPPGRMLDVFCTAAAEARIAVIEGMMGLYDGELSTNDVGSTAQVARLPLSSAALRNPSLR